jgi:dienelactone hydrolase
LPRTTIRGRPRRGRSAASPCPTCKRITKASNHCRRSSPDNPKAYTPIYLRHLRDEHAVERATIPVENIRGPILLVSGTDDQMWPSSVLADIPMRRLESNGFRFPFQHLKYEGAGHLILLPYGPRTTHIIGFKAEGFSCLLYTQGGTPRTDAEAGADAWHRMLQFLEASAKDRK